jgi:hypothetical protein
MFASRWNLALRFKYAWTDEAVSSSGKNENRICYLAPMMISPSGINEAGKSIAEPSERTRATSTGDSTALRFGLVKPGAAYRERPTAYKIPFLRDLDKPGRRDSAAREL